MCPRWHTPGNALVSQGSATYELCFFKRVIIFHGKRHPRDLSEVEVSAFLSPLAETRRVSASTQNQALSACLFLYRHVLRQELGDLAPLVRATRSARLPVVLTRDEVRAILERLDGG